ncbi:MAG TPA: phosphatidylserine decarboxylase [Sedimenticola thiotaurini]|uniref:Phosphatidylserine decarboxylase proenzyme n=1 Tax=Sedimenticola thiotaurini TaxID=1543721 RepID=A0A831RPL6_9GAMM|nr:phosphatidylserine decarboxylase [Sedimenticola thiotaurini]
MTSPSPDTDSREPAWWERLFGLFLLLLPHHLLSRLMYWLTRSEWPPLKDLLIRSVIRLYQVDLSAARHTEPRDYPSFNAFFTRALRPGTRPLEGGEEGVVSPVDGTVSQAGTIEDGRIFQAKGQDYTLDELLGGNSEWTSAFVDGHFATLYLSPRDYHRIHMPLGGRLLQMTHVPGRLFSVSPVTTRVVPRLFARNERIVNIFDTGAGPMALIMVGAIFVASMDTVWAGTVAPASRRITHWDYSGTPPSPVELARGEEMGRFNMGSTVILLFGKERVEWDESLRPGAGLLMGEQIGGLVQPAMSPYDPPLP